MADSHNPSPSPSPFGREQQVLTIREFELYRESQSKLEDERELRRQEMVKAMERLIDAKMLASEAKGDARFTSGDKALALATVDTGKHLEALNGEQARLAKDRERFIPREAYEVAQKEFQMWRDQVNTVLSIGKGRDTGIGLSWGVVLSLISAAVAVGSIILVLLKK